jgi:hypothetical protein
MIRFVAGVYCHLFRLEIANVLHHASIWSTISGVTVHVTALADGHDVAGTLNGCDFAIDLDVDAGRELARAQLADYLRRVLDTRYAIEDSDAGICVDWHARRSLVCRYPAAPFAPPAPAQS